MPLKLIQGKQLNVNLTGSFTGSFSGSFNGTGSYAVQALSASYTENAATASNILGGKATHIPYFISDTTLATSSLYQSGSGTVIINQDNATSANPEALYVWQPHPTSFNVVSGKGNLNNYLQLNIANTNQGINASSDIVATANNGDETTNYIDMGINSENYNSGFIGDANDAYLYSTGLHLHIGNASDEPVMFFAGGSDVDLHNKLILNPNNQHQMTGSLEISGSLKVNQGITGSLLGTSSYAIQALSASWAPIQVSSSYAATASYAPAYLPLTGGTINGNVTVTGTASIAFLNVQFESASVIYSSGSNIFGDATNDTQTLNGTVIVSGSQQITGSLNVLQGITGSLFGTASYATSASYALTSSYSTNITGSTNYLPKFTGANSLSNSLIYDNGTNVGIGTTTPAYKFDVSDIIRAQTKIIAGIFTPGAATGSSTIITTGRISAGGGITFYNPANGDNQDTGFKSLSTGVISAYSSNGVAVEIAGYGSSAAPLLKGIISYNPSTGTSVTKNFIEVTGPINTSGTYSGGIIRGLYYTPTLTSIVGVTSHRAIETVTGDVILGSTSGNVGIGTTAPAYRLDVSGSIRATSGSQIRVDSATDGNYVSLQERGITFSRTNGASIGAYITSSDNTMNLYARSGLSLYAGGNGTQILYLNDENSVTQGSVLITGTNTATNSGSLHIRNSANTQVFKVFNGGAVAIGNVTTPSASLHIKGASTSSLSSSFLIQNSALTSSFTVLDNGYVGILNGAPTVPLEIGQNLGTQGKLRLWSGNVQWAQLEGGDSMLDINVQGGYAAHISRNGGYKLAIPANSQFAFGNANGGGSPIGTLDTGISRLSAGKVSIGNGTVGNTSGTLIASVIGIGTSTPNAALDINGNAIITGSVEVYSGTVTLTNSANALIVTSSQSTALQVVGGNNGNNIALFKNLALDSIVANVNTSGSIFTSGSLTALQGITGSLFGTASWAVSASYVLNAVSASYSNNSTSASYALTASFATTASFLNSTTNAFIQNGNSFGTTALLGTNDNQSLALETNGTTKMFISSSGNVGIGTTSPAYLLDVQGGTARVYGGAISIDQPVGTSSNLYLNQVGLINWYLTNTATSGLLKIGNGNGDLFNITSTGNVGIGTTAPVSKLDVYGAITTQAGNNIVGLHVSGAASYIKATPSNGTSNIVINSQGATLTLSTTANSYADVRQSYSSQTLRVGTAAVANGGGLEFYTGDGTASNFRWYMNNASITNLLMTMTSAGNVGIGNATPNAKLDVNGNTIITGSLQVSQSIFQYSNNAAILSGTTANIASFATSSYMAGFFDFVASSGSNARAGTVFTVWNGTSLEYVETSTNDIGSTTNLILSASLSGSNVRLQGTSLLGSWNVKTLTRMI